MRVKFKQENQIQIVESFYAHETTNGIDVHYAYTSYGMEFQATYSSFYTNNAKELLDKAFETGLLDLTSAELAED